MNSVKVIIYVYPTTEEKLNFLLKIIKFFFWIFDSMTWKINNFYNVSWNFFFTFAFVLNGKCYFYNTFLRYNLFNQTSLI